jgi:hypothetical protein
MVALVTTGIGGWVPAGIDPELDAMAVAARAAAKAHRMRALMG